MSDDDVMSNDDVMPDLTFPLYSRFFSFSLESDESDENAGENPENIVESLHVGHHEFAAMTGDQDTISHERLQGRSQEEMRIYDQQKV